MTHDESSLVALLAKRYPSPEYAFLPQVPDGTTTNKRRTVDALALGLWRSRGFAMHGFECKVSRGDWLRERKNPLKAETIAVHCDYWWVVAGDGDMIPVDELPDEWGLMVAEGKSLKVIRAAPKRTPEPITLPILCGILRRATEGVVPKESVRDQIDDAYQRGRKDADRHASHDSHKRAYDQLLADMKAFEAASGVCVSRGWDGKKIGDAVARFMRIENAIATFDTLVANFQDRVKRTLAVAESLTSEDAPSDE